MRLPRLAVALGILLFSFAIRHSAFAAPSPQDGAAKALAAELTQLVRDNNAKTDKLFREMAELGRNKKHSEITNHYAQIAALLAQEEAAFAKTAEVVKATSAPVASGIPSNHSRYRLHMETARALCNPLHLHWAGLAARHYAEALKLADTPRRKADAIFAAGRLEYDVAADDDPAPAIAKIRSAFAVPGLSKGDLLDLWFRYPTDIDPAFDVQAEAWKLAEDVPALHGAYYLGILPPYPRGQNTTLDPALSSERVLEICRQGLADPAVAGGPRDRLRNREVDALVDLGRFQEAEQSLLSYAATTDQRTRATWCRRLGDFYVEQAWRYYLPSHAPTLRKAFAAYFDASIANPDDTRVVETMCSIAMRLREYRAAERAVGRRVEQNKGETNAWAWAQLGRIAYEKGDYAAAAAAFGATEGKLEIENRRLYARSLKALNRIEEAVAQLEKVEKEDNRFRRGTDRYYIQYLRKKAEAGR